MIKHQICPVCFGTGKGIQFKTDIELIPFIRILQIEQHWQSQDRSYVAMVENFIAEIGWEKYLDRIFNYRIKATKMDLTCFNCLGEGIVISSDETQKEEPDWSDQGQDWLKDFLQGLGLGD